MKHTLVILSLAFAVFVTGTAVHAQYNTPGFTLKNNSTCTGGTKILDYGDVQDTGAGIAAKSLATQDCQYLMTGPDQCCSVKYRRATPASPAIGSHVFMYEIYQGGTVTESVPPAGTLTSSFQHWAGVSGPANSCLGTWRYAQTDYSDASCVVSANSACVPNPNNTNFYSGLATCPSKSPEGSACTFGSPVLLQGVKGPRTYGSNCKWNYTEGSNSNIVITDVYNCVGASGQPVTAASCNATPPPVTAALIANPNSIFEGEQSLLSWSSTGATECTGSNFSTGGEDSGSAIVAPDETTQYSVTCTGAGGSATANATVSVTQPNDPDPAFGASCRAHPSSVGINEDVLWSSTVTGPAGTYTYAWGGTDGLSGSGNQVFKKYTSSGSKNGQLTVTYTPELATTAPSPAAPATSASPATGAVTPPPTEITPGSAAVCPALGWVTPVTPCAGLWAPTYGTGGCQNGWQCQASTGGSGGGGSIVQPEDTGFVESILDFFRYDVSSERGIPEIQTVEGSVLPGYAEMVTVACENSVNVRVPQCSDGIDNDNDYIIDYPEDPGCDSRDDDDEFNDDDTNDDGDLPQCSDGIDNDGDGDADAADPGCNIGSGGGGGGSYNPNGNSESGAGGAGSPQCSDNVDNNGDGNIDFPDDPGCTSENDNLEFTQPADVTFTADPPLVKKNQSCTLTLSARSVSSCSLSGPGLSRSFTAVGGLISLKEVVTPSLAQSSTFTLSCNGLDGKRTSKSVDCKIAPTFEEF